MRQRENRNIFIFLLLWSSLVIMLFLHTSGRVDIPLLHFPQAKGNLMMIEEGYKHYNLVGLREKVYAIPQGSSFIHPRRIEKMKEIGIFVAHSAQEVKRMIDAETENIEPKNIEPKLIEEGYKHYNLVGLREKVYAVPQGKPFIHTRRIEEMKKDGIFVAHSAQEAKRMIDAETENIEPKLILKEENFQGHNLYSFGRLSYSVPAMDPALGPYWEQVVGENLKEAKRFIMQKETLVK